MNPIISQLEPLIDKGIITLDHLIKEKRQGGVSEKGPLFKITPSGLSLLFPQSESYTLI